MEEKKKKGNAATGNKMDVCHTDTIAIPTGKQVLL